MGVPTGHKTLHSLHFADDQLVITQLDEGLEYVTKKLQEGHEAWSLISNLTRTKCLSLGNPGHNFLSRKTTDTIKHCGNYKYLGMKDVIQKFRTIHLRRYEI
jgi:hypothetical protein